MSRPLTSEPAPFDLTGPLPSGTVLLEASAGTGKTYTIAGLATRWVAETEIRLPELLVITFTRAATAELRDRVRTRLVGAANHLEAVLRGAPPDTDDPVLGPLASGGEEELRRRLARLDRAVADVDVATIATIHGFCQHVLEGLGIASDLDRDAELVNDVLDLVEEVVDDLLVATYLQRGDRPRIAREQLLAVGRAVVENPDARLVPRRASDPTAGLRLHLAERIRSEVTRRAHQRRLMSYDDLLMRLDRTLHDRDRGEAAREALRQRYRVALIDEFQDTDPVQWRVVSRAFTDTEHDEDTDGRALVLIGDPKQAIYAFRGADVHAYLDAARGSGHRRTLATSWRADAGLLTAFEALFAGVRFGHVEIPYRRVQPAPGNDASRLVGVPMPTPLRLRVVPRHPSLPQNGDKPAAEKVRELIANDLAADVVRLLEARPERVDRGRDGAETGRRLLVPGDVAVLVRSHDQAALVQETFREVGVPAVVGGAGSVFATPAATDWRRLLDALERPASPTRVRALALSPWIGWTATELAGDDGDRCWDQLHEDVHRWARILADRGVAALFRTVQLQRRVPQRLLAVVGGERLLADLEHLAELAHAAATAEHLGTSGLSTWFRERVAEAMQDVHDERLRRLETDHDAVQILTIHGSKGLEFPVVYCPFLWSSASGVRGEPVFHDVEGGRQIDVGGSGHEGYDEHLEAAASEQRAEELRLLYVALTRAQHQVVAWYAPAGLPEWSGLGRVLLCRDEAGRPDTDCPAPLPDDTEVVTRLTALADAAGGTIAVETVPAQPSTTGWRPEGQRQVRLDRARFSRRLDEAWRRTSYSALTRLDDQEPQVGSEPDEPVKDDEAVGPEPVPNESAASGADDAYRLRQVSLPLAETPGGVHVGTFVHHVLEHTDFAARDLAGSLARVVDVELKRRGLDLDPEQVVTGLHAAIETPLGPTAGGMALREVRLADRRDEVAFELPLDRIGGEGRAATVADVAALMREHLPVEDPLAGYAETLPRALLVRRLRGFLGGSIDLVLRRTSEDGPVFHVVDYKTNRLGARDDPLTAWDYRPAALAGAMGHGHYPIQALLYAVAVHRMLRWRLPGYDPASNLGSILYLFLRGMAGPATPAPGGEPCGVFAWEPPPALVTAASDLLHGVSR